MVDQLKQKLVCFEVSMLILIPILIHRKVHVHLFMKCVFDTINHWFILLLGKSSVYTTIIL